VKSLFVDLTPGERKSDWRPAAGLVCVWYKDMGIHFPVLDREHWHFGYEEEEYDKMGYYFGLGPLFLFVRLW
jgi:hypothetical protein